MKVLLVLFLFLLPVAAQDEPVEKYFRIICLGDLPPWKEKIKNGVRVRIEPPAGSLPPINLSTAGKAGRKQTFLNRLNTISPALSFRTDLEQVDLSAGKGAQRQLWKSLKPSKSVHSLVVFRSGKKDWRQPAARTMPDSVEAFPAGKMRLVNFGHLPIWVKLGKDEPFRIGAGKGLIREVTVGETDLRIEARNAKGKSFRIFRNVFQLRKGERINAFIYKADGVKPRRPLKLLLHAEHAANYRAARRKAVK